MAIRRFSTSNLTGGKSSKLWDQTTFQSGMFALATVNLTSSQSVITFSSIPNTYTHLQIRFIGKNNNNSALYVQFNGVGGTSYTTHWLRGDGSTVGAGAYTSDAYARILPNAGTPTSAQTNIFAAGVIDVFDYANANKYKTVKVLSGYDANGSGGLDFSSGVFMSTTAVSSITIGGFGTGIQGYSSFALYGIKAAP